jgi:hypothetical protein
MKIPSLILLGNLFPNSAFNNPQRGRIYSPNGICPAIDTMGGAT